MNKNNSKMIKMCYILGMVLLMNGCAYFGWLGHVLTPPQTIEPEYVMEKESRLLVILDDHGRLDVYRSARKDLWAKLKSELIANEVVDVVIERQVVRGMALSDPAFERRTPVERGKKLQADLALVIDINHLSLKNRAAEQWDAECTLTLKLFDIKKGEMIWPAKFVTDGKSMTVNVEPDRQRVVEPAYRKVYVKEVAEEIAEKIAKKFYEYEEEPK